MPRLALKHFSSIPAGPGTSTDNKNPVKCPQWKNEYTQTIDMKWMEWMCKRRCGSDTNWYKMKDSESIRWNSISFNSFNANACELCVCAGSRRATNLISLAFLAFAHEVFTCRERREWKLWSIYVKTDDLCLDDRNKSMSLICIRTLHIRATGHWLTAKIFMCESGQRV